MGIITIMIVLLDIYCKMANVVYATTKKRKSKIDLNAGEKGMFNKYIFLFYLRDKSNPFDTP